MKAAVITQKVQWKPGKRFSVKVEVAHHSLEMIRKKYKRLDPATIVAEAEREDHPLHRCFNWNNDEAAQRWREHQARNLINSIEVIYQENVGRDDAKTINIAPCYVANQIENGYLNTEEAIEDIDTRELIVNAAVAGLRGWKERYGRLKEMSDVVEAIQKTEQKVNRKKPARVAV